MRLCWESPAELCMCERQTTGKLQSQISRLHFVGHVWKGQIIKKIHRATTWLPEMTEGGLRINQKEKQTVTHADCWTEGHFFWQLSEIRRLLSSVIRPLEISPKRFSLLTSTPSSPPPSRCAPMALTAEGLHRRTQHAQPNQNWMTTRYSLTDSNTLLRAETGIKKFKSAVKIHVDSSAHDRLLIKCLKHDIYSVPSSFSQFLCCQFISSCNSYMNVGWNIDYQLLLTRRISGARPEV